MFATLTVEENLDAVVPPDPRARAACAPASTRRTSCSRVLGERRDQDAGTLSGGEQRMLSLARVMVEEPKLLIADELSLGLAPIVVGQLVRSLADAARRRHRAARRRAAGVHALDLCDRVVVLDHGLVSWTGDVADAGDVVEQAFTPAG